MNKKNIVNADGQTIGYVDGFKAMDIKGFTYGCVAYFGGPVGNVSFCGTRVGGVISGKLVPQANGTMLLTR